ncbi:cwfj c-terminus 1 family protein, putative [Babesia ovis]|uniref:Cwfj c-terminus 1 family protein, putative n=1 Tax=Babesia ovis TaxID=5869 RepID=A0A9W5T857_BABOV|nr:cwfj c-terminus 1 family protein, putative [Babesia ovis]
MGYGFKRHRGEHRRDRHDGRPVRQVQIDEALYMANRDAAVTLRTRILKREDAEGHKLGPCQFRQICTYQQLDNRPRPPMQRTEGSSTTCPFCPSSRQRELQISQSQTAYLAMEQRRNAILCDQLVLAPKQHVQSTLYLDDQTYTELRNYQKTLVRMFHEQDKAVIFVETALNDPYHRNKEDGGTRYQQHCYIQCFAIPVDAVDEAKSMFRRAFNELVSDWGQNRKIISVTEKTGVRNLVPRGFDFVHVDYGLSGDGIACVVEDLSKITASFAREVVAGVLRMDAMERAFRSSDKQLQALSWISKQYQSFDWVNLE